MTPPRPEHASARNGQSPSDRGSRSSGTASNSRRSPGIAAAMGQISCLVCDARRRRFRRRSHPVTGQFPTPRGQALREIPPKQKTRTRRLRKRPGRRQSAYLNPRTQSQEQYSPPSRIRCRVGQLRVLLRLPPRGRRGKLRIRARPLVPKGKLCNPKPSFPISGAVSRTETRPQNLL
jgi:hypothetical protein